MLVTLLGIFASLLPRSYRGRYLNDANVDIKRGAVLSGAAEFFLTSVALWFRYPVFIHRRMAESASAVAARYGSDKLVAGFSDLGSGVLGLVEYLLQPLSLLLIYFLLEAVVRLFAAVVSDEIVPSLPLQAVAWLHGAGARRQEITLGVRVIDLVQPGDEREYDLRIASCRPKDWDQLLTISYNDQLYELSRELSGAPPRRFVYLLRKAPAGKVIRGLRHYDPAEVLGKPESHLR